MSERTLNAIVWIPVWFLVAVPLRAFPLMLVAPLVGLDLSWWASYAVAGTLNVVASDAYVTWQIQKIEERISGRSGQ